MREQLRDIQEREALVLLVRDLSQVYTLATDQAVFLALVARARTLLASMVPPERRRRDELDGR